MTNLVSIFNQAVTYHQSGRVLEAINLYLKILPSQRENDEFLFAIGTAYCQVGQLEDGLKFLRKSSRLNPKNFHVYGNMARVLTDLRRYDEAVLNYNKALLTNPNFLEALLGRGNAYSELSRYDEAIADYDRALFLAPDFALAFCNKGKALYELRKFEDALICLNQAVLLSPDFAEAYSNRGNVYKELSNYEEALDDYSKAIQLNPNLAGVYSNRGCVLEELKRYEEAIKDHSKAIVLKPDYAEAYSNRGNALQELSRLEEALIDHDKAIFLRQDYAAAYTNRGNVLAKQARLNEALVDHGKAIALNPMFAEAYSNQGNVLQQMARIDEALASYDKAIQLKPDFVNAHWNKSLALLLGGDYTNGWLLYEWRWRSRSLSSNKRCYAEPIWLGDALLDGKTILVYPEQGLGDVVQFSRYIPLLVQKGAKVILEVPKPLVAIIKTLPCEMTVVESGSALPSFDLQCPIMSLPLAFKTTVESIPADFPYLQADKGKVAIWKKKILNESRLRVGLVWSGGFRPNQPEVWAINERRNISLDKLKALKMPEIDFYSLQKGDEAIEQLERLTQSHWDGPQIIDYSKDFNDFSDTAALIENLDLIVAVDTSTAHVAGAMGKTVWLLNRFDTDWRWFHDRTCSPWYPSIRIFRQPSPGDWESVVDEVKAALENLLLVRQKAV